MEKKKSLGRRKIEIKQIEKGNRRNVTFSKRKRGLFNKATQLSTLCGAHVAVFVKTPAGNLHVFGNPSVDAVVHHFHGGAPPPEHEPQPSNAEGDLGSKKEEEEWSKGWWESPIDELGFGELEEYVSALQGLRNNVAARAHERAFISACESELMKSVDSVEFLGDDFDYGKFLGLF